MKKIILSIMVLIPLLTVGNTKAQIWVPVQWYNVSLTGLTEADSLEIVGILRVIGAEGVSSYIYMFADEGDDAGDKWLLSALSSDPRFSLSSYASGSWRELISFDDTGSLGSITMFPYGADGQGFSVDGRGEGITAALSIIGGTDKDADLYWASDSSRDDVDTWAIRAEASDNTFMFMNYGTGSFVDIFKLGADSTATFLGTVSVDTVVADTARFKYAEVTELLDIDSTNIPNDKIGFEDINNLPEEFATKMDLSVFSGSLRDVIIQAYLDSVYSGGISKDSLVLYMPFDYDTEFAMDYSGEGNDGTINGVTHITDPDGFKVGGGAYRFDGSDYISIDDDVTLDITDAITIIAWIYPIDNNSRVIAAKRDDSNYAWEFAISNDATSNYLLGKINDNSNEAVSSARILEGVWTHVAMTYNKDAGEDDEIKTYINGSLDGIGDYATAISTNNVVVSIGRRMHSSPDYFIGSIDEVKVYSRDLSPSEIREDYLNGLEQHNNLTKADLHAPNDFSQRQDMDSLYVSGAVSLADGALQIEADDSTTQVVDLDITGATKPNKIFGFGGWFTDPEFVPDLVDTVAVTADGDTVGSGWYPSIWGAFPDTSTVLSKIDVFFDPIDIPPYFVGVDSIVIDYKTGINDIDSCYAKVIISEFAAATGITTFLDSTASLVSADTWTHNATLTTLSALTRYDKFLIRIEFASMRDYCDAYIARFIIYWKKGS